MKTPFELSRLSKNELLHETREAAKKEREATHYLIECLREIDRKMIYAEMEYSSLWQFCREYLGLSEGSTQRRIETARLIHEVPEVSEAIKEGTLSITTAAQVQTFFSMERRQGKKMDSDQKRDLVESVQGLSKRQIEKKLVEISPRAIPREKTRELSVKQTEVKLVLNSETLDQMNQLKDLLAHQLPTGSYGELVELLIREKLAQVNKKKEKAAREEIPTKTHDSLSPGIVERKHIPAPLKRAVWHRAGSQCEYKNGEGQRCTSKHRLQMDHIIALALGGKTDFSNLRLLCRNHNVHQAVLQLGQEKMSRYMPRLR